MAAQNYMAFRCELERYRKSTKNTDRQLSIGLLISDAITAYREKNYEKADELRIKAKILAL